MEIKELEAAMKTAVKSYRAEHAEILGDFDSWIEQVLTSGEVFLIFWAAEMLRLRLGVLADHLCQLRGILESRN